MNAEDFSFTVRCWYDQQAALTRLQVLRVDTGEEVLLRDSQFVVRVSLEENATIARCFIRHVESGRETFVQGGAGLRAFVKTCLLAQPETPASDQAGNN